MIYDLFSKKCLRFNIFQSIGKMFLKDARKLIHERLRFAHSVLKGFQKHLANRLFLYKSDVVV